MEKQGRARWWMGRRDIRGVRYVSQLLTPSTCSSPNHKAQAAQHLNPGHRHPAPKYERGTDHSLKQCFWNGNRNSSLKWPLLSQRYLGNWRQVCVIGIRGCHKHFLGGDQDAKCPRRCPMLHSMRYSWR